ncbi:hypothetical protein TeGR_g7003 [Tetraparma gracilis]|uniref:XPG N-terminal domain-containing protein n=1 Tax=Tetraparma gracilis TaxID=2962635 RepID=A0ABQ6MM43_9STRA|nr:hypothetical protein TeGR_g7003 [Tetraparma gracilis]
MGIKDLWPTLKPLLTVASLDDFEGGRVALDVSIVVHSTVHALAPSRMNTNLITNHGRLVEASKTSADRLAFSLASSSSFVDLVVKSVTNKIFEMVQRKVELLVVLDGATPPIKYTTTRRRTGDRDRAKERLREETAKLSRSATPVEPAGDEAAPPAFVDPDAPEEPAADLAATTKSIWQSTAKLGASSEEFTLIFRRLLSAFRDARIPFVVSPYEADAQLAFLANTVIGGRPAIDLVVSSDSDVVPCAVPLVLKALDHSGAGDLYRRGSLTSSWSAAFDLGGFTEGMVACMCVLMGCDYLPNPAQVGPKTARRLVKESFEPYFEDPRTADPPLEVRKGGYEKSFLNALVMFRHPVVYDFQERCSVIAASSDPELECYAAYRDMVEDEDVVQGIAGEMLPDKLAEGIAEGWIDPKGMQIKAEDGTHAAPPEFAEALKEWEEDGGRGEWEKARGARKAAQEALEKELEEYQEKAREEQANEDERRNEATRRVAEDAKKREEKREEKLVRKAEKKEKKKKKKKKGGAEAAIRERFVKLYSEHAPAKVKIVDKIMRKYAANLEEAIAAAEAKYGVVAEEEEEKENSEAGVSQETLLSNGGVFDTQAKRVAQVAHCQQKAAQKRKGGAGGAGEGGGGGGKKVRSQAEEDENDSQSTNLDDSSLPAGWTTRGPSGTRNSRVEFGEGGETPSVDGMSDEEGAEEGPGGGGAGGGGGAEMMPAAGAESSEEESSQEPVKKYAGFC